MITFTKQNKHMDALLSFFKDKKASQTYKSFELTSSFFDFINDEIISENGLFFLKSKSEIIQNSLEQTKDLIEIECFANSINSYDFLILGNRDKFQLLNVGFTIFKLLTIKLKENFPKEQFVISLSYDLSSETEGLNDCNVKFYKKRIEFDPWLLDDLELYKEAAVGICE